MSSVAEDTINVVTSILSTLKDDRTILFRTIDHVNKYINKMINICFLLNINTLFNVYIIILFLQNKEIENELTKQNFCLNFMNRKILINKLIIMFIILGLGVLDVLAIIWRLI